VIASIEDPPVIERILDHLGRGGESSDPANPSPGTAPGRSVDLTASSSSSSPAPPCGTGGFWLKTG
jgi:hypothetical protein